MQDRPNSSWNRLRTIAPTFAYPTSDSGSRRMKKSYHSVRLSYIPTSTYIRSQLNSVKSRPVTVMRGSRGVASCRLIRVVSYAIGSSTIPSIDANNLVQSAYSYTYRRTTFTISPSSNDSHETSSSPSLLHSIGQQSQAVLQRSPLLLMHRSPLRHPIRTTSFGRNDRFASTSSWDRCFCTLPRSAPIISWPRSMIIGTARRSDLQGHVARSRAWCRLFYRSSIHCLMLAISQRWPAAVRSSDRSIARNALETRCCEFLD